MNNAPRRRTRGSGCSLTAVFGMFILCGLILYGFVTYMRASGSMRAGSTEFDSELGTLRSAHHFLQHARKKGQEITETDDGSGEDNAKVADAKQP